MTEAKDKLMKLEELIPGRPNGVLYAFGQFLAGYLNDQLVPMGFIMGCELALYDLQSGVNGFTGQPISSSLVGYPPIIYAGLRMGIAEIAATIFPTEFAEQVKNHIAKICEKRS
jgi:hypothetical protein